MTFLERAKALVSQMTLDEKMAQMRYESPAIQRLGIPAYNWWNECLHGVARAGTATVFPQAIGMAASFDDELLKTVAEAISDEAGAVAAAPASSFEVDVDVTELMGAEIYLYLNVGEETRLIARVSSRSQSRAGDKIKVAFDMSRLHVFDKDTERCVLH